jgi:16S rRNA (guanine527-N7)-methyltransferase
LADENAFSDLLIEQFSPIGRLSQEQCARLYRHYALLIRWNRVLNLTTVTRMEDAVVRHYCESLFLASLLPNEPVSVLDAGSGAGFPGVPMAVLRPDCQFTLVESHQRKAVFLREATRDYNNVRILARRADQVEGEFEWTVSRAVRWEDVLPLARTHIGLLLGQEDAECVLRAPEFEWSAPVPLPWGKRRVALLGRRST